MESFNEVIILCGNYFTESILNLDSGNQSFHYIYTHSPVHHTASH